MESSTSALQAKLQIQKRKKKGERPRDTLPKDLPKAFGPGFTAQDNLREK